MASQGKFDELSTLGGDWDNDSQTISYVAGGTLQPEGDVDADDLDADRQKYLDANAVIVDGFRCPDEYINVLSPMEFEEMVLMFTKYDANHSGTIDKYEVKRILHDLGMDFSLERAESLLAVIDSDGSGEIDFEEFCHFIVMIKRGDERLEGFEGLLHEMNNTPLGVLEHQAKQRDLEIKFIIKQQRAPSLTAPPMFVIELTLSGMWHETVDGQLTSSYQVKRYQGLGETTREAKYQAATQAVINLGKLMPGVKYEQGFFPDEWLEWVDENLLRGVDPGEIVKILAAKGFHPHKNLGLMQRIICSKSLEKFIKNHPELDLTSSNPKIDQRFLRWMTDTARRGVDGKVLLTLLQDRCIDITKEHLHLSQKLRNNEVGSLMGTGVQKPELLDFWTACRNGFLDEVVLYCKCGADVNEDLLDRHRCEWMRPLSLAAIGGFADVITVLIKYGAEVNGIDRRGRTALHHAANEGNTAACKKLIENGGMMFIGDLHGNRPLHLAALNNHPETVDYLAYQGQELTRQITSNKIFPRKYSSFEKICEEIYEEMPAERLTPNETVRFEKEWLADANNVFIRKMDIDVRHMLAPSCSEIMIDVLQRFDNRPETGIFVSHKSGNKFVRTIPTVADLIHLLRYMMRQSALDNINKWTRTALHLACDMNKVESHQQVILRLVDYHGANVHIRDIHGRTPMQLLIQDKDPGNNPSATKLREEAIIDRRESHLVTLFKAFDEEEKASMLKRQKKILDECIERENMMSKRLWEATRLASIFVRKYNNWEMYQDPDSENFFYVQIPDNAFAGDTYDNFSWTLPETINAQVHRMDALAYIKHYKARMVRKVANWEMYQGLMDPFNFYYDPETEQLTFAVPREVSWPLIFRKGKKNMDNYGYAEKLGYANEWEVHTDADGNSFYLNTVTRQCEWEKPIDAVIPSPLEKLCTAHQHKGKSIEQKWYSCEQCNRAWKSSSEGNTKTVKLCEPCVFRCHKGHKGIRYIRTSAALCSCSDACKVTNSICKACQISDIQQKKQQESYGYSIEQKRKALHDLNTPLVLAMIPRLLPNGTAKTVSGWHFCRKVPQQITDTLKSPDFFTTYPSDPNFNRSKPYSDTDSDDSDVLVIVDPSIKLLSEAEHNNTLYCVEGLPPDWIHVYDVEEPEDLKFGDRVLCLRYSGLPRVYGTIRSAVRRGYYRIRYDDDHLQDEVLERSHIECLSRDTFFCNLKTGQSVWSIDDVDDETKYHNSCTLTLSGPDWFDIHRDSTLKRVFKDWDEMINHPLNFSYFLRPGHLLVEKAILQVQINARIKLRFPRRFTPWISTAFTFDIPSTVWLEKKERAGWAYLRRRSTNVGEVLDVDGAEWDEYMDSKTAEHFYWEEEENLYRWDKPELFKRPDKKQIETLPIGEEVLYRFPGRRGDENAFVTKVRFDDETGEDMYDLQHKYNQELSCKWIKRMNLRLVPKEGDALLLANLEVKWKNQIRKQRDIDERKRKREKELRQQEEVARLAEMKNKVYLLSLATGETEVSQSVRLMRTRMARINLEAQEVREEIDRVEGFERREKVRIKIEEMRNELGGKLSRADALVMARSLDMKLQLDEAIAKREGRQEELFAKRQKELRRIKFLEDTLRENEVQMTTPRSLLRRKLIRRMHVAMKRQQEGFMICEWGCHDWFKVGIDQIDHQQRKCLKRIIPCALGCETRHTEEYWLSEYKKPEPEVDLITPRDDDDESVASSTHGDVSVALGVVTNQQHHETKECRKRLVLCPLNCLEWVRFEELEHHKADLCTKRPAQPIACRLGCGCMFGGLVETLIQAEDERLEHESEQCEYRLVRCNWTYEDGTMCAAQMKANERAEHRDYHLTLQGVKTYSVPGIYQFRVTKSTTRLKVQLWGGGGGSGFFRGREGGCGGGGAFVEAIVDLEPFTILEITVGAGGQGGVCGTAIQAVPIDEQRRLMGMKRELEKKLPVGTNLPVEEDMTRVDVIDGNCGVALGGQPGGGEGYGGGSCWASGGGGGYSMIAKRTVKGNQALLVAAGGGGAGTNSGLPGAAMDGILPGTVLDPINGSTATVNQGGAAGDSGTTFNAAWPATDGSMWQGGNGCEFGAGGGGGYFGGGGAGTTPGLAGGGGGGSSYVYLPIIRDYVMIHGHGHEPGGKNHNPPEAAGVGEWDRVGGLAGLGGVGTPFESSNGKNGAVRIIKPGHY